MYENTNDVIYLEKGKNVCDSLYKNCVNKEQNHLTPNVTSQIFQTVKEMFHHQIPYIHILK